VSHEASGTHPISSTVPKSPKKKTTKEKDDIIIVLERMVMAEADRLALCFERSCVCALSLEQG
jgi:hypothetical protein